ncbi:MAG: GNAT family N-acetyltransferase [Bryobacteraceae bacterium]|jgi:RimJ/RimL family protein N-acetyltransferase
MKTDKSAAGIALRDTGVTREAECGITDAGAAEVREMAGLLRDWPLHPYSAYASDFEDAAYSEFRDWRARKISGGVHSRTIVARSSGSIVASACWSFLPWDTEQLAVSCARFEWLASEGPYALARRRKTALAGAVIGRCQADGIHYLTARIHAGDLSSIHALEEKGFELIDGIQTFSIQLDSAGGWPAAGAYRIRLYEPRDLGRILAIARSSYVFDRFHMDASLPREAADSVNERWVENACLGTAADAVVVALDGEVPVGYVTCTVDKEAGERLGILFGTVGMVATDPMLRGRGVARAATYGALGWFASQGVRVVEVGTQIANIPAGRLYEECEFRLVANSLTFRKTL